MHSGSSSAALMPAIAFPHVIVPIPCDLASRSHLKLVILFLIIKILSIHCWNQVYPVSQICWLGSSIYRGNKIWHGLSLVNPSWMPAVTASFYIGGLVRRIRMWNLESELPGFKSQLHYESESNVYLMLWGWREMTCIKQFGQRT